VADASAQHAGPKKRLDPYFFEPRFERAVALYACRSTRFWGRVGKDLEPDALGCDEAKHAVRAAVAIAQDNQRGPGSLIVALQRLRSWVEDGKLSPEDVEAVSDYFDAAEDAGLPPEEDVVAELAKLLKKRAKGDIARAAAADYAAKNDFENTKREIARAEAIGGVDTTVGVELGEEAFAAIEADAKLKRLSTGILDLDMLLNGGRPFGTLNMYAGGPGVGKSMALSHEACSDIRAGLHTAYATLEVPIPGISARIMANLTGVPIDAILAEPRCAERALAQLKLGRLHIQAFSPRVTTMEDIAEWVKSLEEKTGHKIDSLKVDYADRMGSRRAKKKDGSSYDLGEHVTQDLWDYANGESHLAPKVKRWVSSATQATRKKDQRKKVTTDDVADSMHKSRITDMLISINQDPDGYVWFVAKNRYGKSDVSAGPLPHELECGRVVEIVEIVVADPMVDAARAAAALGGKDAVVEFVKGTDLKAFAVGKPKRVKL